MIEKPGGKPPTKLGNGQRSWSQANNGKSTGVGVAKRGTVSTRSTSRSSAPAAKKSSPKKK